MTGRLTRTMSSASMPLLLSLPSLAALLATLVLPGGALGWAAGAAVGVLMLALELSHQLRQGVDSARLWTREVMATVQAQATTQRRLVVAEQKAERRRRDVSPETSRIFRIFTQLVRAEEATRAQIAADLHDAVAQTLSRALVELRAEDPAAALETVSEAEEQLRGVMARIRPPELADGDLARAVADLVSDLDGRYGVAVAVSWPSDSVPLPAVLATTLYRFVQEALMNAVVHADGVDVSLAVTVHGHELHVEVTDRGPGFDPAAVVSADGRHVGLRLSRERARLAGGVVEISSALGAGTRLLLRLPIQGEPDVDAPRRATLPVAHR